jgi:hypothetical protein
VIVISRAFEHSALSVGFFLLTSASPLCAAQFFGLGDVIGGPGLSPQRITFLDGLSRDGSTVAGIIQEGTPTGYDGVDVFRWRRDTGMVGLGFPAQRLAINHDGSTILSPRGNFGEFTLWTETGGAQMLGPLGPDGPFIANGPPRTNGNYFFRTAFPRDVSVVDFSNTYWYRWTEATGLEAVRPGGIQDMSLNGIGVGGSTDGHAFIWTEEEGEQRLISESHFSSGANRISDDGSVIVGTIIDVEGGLPSLFRWTQAQGVQRLGPISGLPTMSRDGASIFYTNENRNFRWKNGIVAELAVPETIGGPTATTLGSLPSLASPSRDGSILTGIVGNLSRPSTETYKVVWREGRGVMSLEDMLVDDFALADSIAGWQLNRLLNSSTGMPLSDDGLVLAGAGLNPAGAHETFVVYLDPDGDYNADSIVDLRDLDLANQHVGESGTKLPATWVNFRPSGVVDQSTLDIVMQNLGKTGPLYDGPILSAGDFNTDGTVDAADYVVWRNGLGATNTQADYETWRANFGRTAASATVGAGLGRISSGGVPEPGTLVLTLLALFTFPRRKS